MFKVSQEDFEADGTGNDLPLCFEAVGCHIKAPAADAVTRWAIPGIFFMCSSLICAIIIKVKATVKAAVPQLMPKAFCFLFL